MSVAVHEIQLSDLERCLDLLERVDSLRAGDALHAATALNRGIEVMISADRHFDAVGALRRIDPADSEAVGEILLSGPSA